MVKVEIRMALDPSQRETLCGLQQSQQVISGLLSGTDKRELTSSMHSLTVTSFL